MKNKFLMSGTLGDAFIVILKLYKNYKNKNVSLNRISRWPDQDNIILKMSKLFPFVTYNIPCIQISKIEETIETIKKLNLNYVNTSWNGSHFKKAEKDFKKIIVEPFPILNLRNIKKKKKKKIISIQVNTGKIGGNCKILSSKWIVEIINFFNKKNYEIILLGTILDKEKSILKQFKSNKNIKILVNKTTFYKWLSIIKSSDFFISPEGFPAFFSMSQKVKTICFYTDKRILTRIHPKWKKYNYIKSVNWKNLYSTIKVIIARHVYKRYPLIYPINPKIIYNYINKKINSEKNLYI